MPRGHLRIYLGAAPGVGKTYAMLAEGMRRRERGTDVVVAFVETHARPRTAEALGDLEVIPRCVRAYRGSRFEEMDLDAVLARRPAVALVDEFAHRNIPGCRHAKRWEDVEELLEAGIDVITTLNIQHLESLNDVVAAITGVVQQETVPDAVARAADQIELVDMTPEALRRRMAHGNIYPPDKVDAALGNYFRAGNLAALRELALLWLADRVDEEIQRYRRDHHIAGTWETRERVVVALTGGPEGETLIRRAARIAARGGAELLAVHVSRSDGLTGADPGALARQRLLVESLGGSYHQVVGDDVPSALLDFARASNATQLVLGASRRGRLATLVGGAGISRTTVRLSGSIDVHIVTHEQAGRGRRPAARRRIVGGRRQLVAAAGGAGLLAGGTLLLANLRGVLNLPSDLMAYLLAVVVVALTGGLLPALGAAVAAGLLLNYFFTPPLYEFTIAQRNNVLALTGFVVVAILVSSVVDLAARRTREAARAAAESTTLATLAGDVVREGAALPQLLARLRETFALTAVTLYERPGPGQAWAVVGHAGTDPPAPGPEGADTALAAGPDLVLGLWGRPLLATESRVLAAYAAQSAAALERMRLAQTAGAAEALEAADRTRTALLAAVSHDLRSPLATATAAVTSLRDQNVNWSSEQVAELLDTAAGALERLSRLVDNLLDMSRISAGALPVALEDVSLAEILPRALDDLGESGATVRLQVPEALPEVIADPGLLERALVNLASNALRYSPPDAPPLISASVLADWVQVRVVDRGPGVPEAQHEELFVPFQRLGDTDNSTGVGLGLAIARGLTEAMGGHLTPEETPGGGLTMVLALPVAIPARSLPATSLAPLT